MGEEKSKTRKTSKFKAMRSEFKKIVWPDRTKLVKQTIAVVSVTAALGVLITVIDAIVKYGVDILVR